MCDAVRSAAAAFFPSQTGIGQKKQVKPLSHPSEMQRPTGCPGDDPDGAAQKHLPASTPSLEEPLSRTGDGSPPIVHDAKRRRRNTGADALPDWRVVPLSSVVEPSLGRIIGEQHRLILEYSGEKPSRKIAVVSHRYRFVQPRDYFTDVARIAASHMQGDVSIMEVRVLASKIFVKYKLPSGFALTSNPQDAFGLTLVACNPYSGREAHSIAAGAIRGFCENGCYFGKHRSLRYDHKAVPAVPRTEEDKTEGVDSKQVISIIDQALPLAQVYVDRLVGKGVARRPGTFGDAPLKTESILEAEVPTQAEAIIRSLTGLTLRQRREVFDEAHGKDGEADRIGLYDLWNACTYVATRQKNPGSQHTMMRAIDEVFAEGGEADQILAAPRE